MSPTSNQASGGSGLGQRAWGRWRRWQLSRPFWGALITIVAGTELMAVLWPRHGLGFWPASGLAGLGQLLLADALIACGLLTWFHPVWRSAYSTATVLLAISTLMTSSVGGYLAGAILGAAGGALSFAWVPGRQVEHTEPRTPPADSPVAGLALVTGDGNEADDGRTAGLPGARPRAGDRVRGRLLG
jgi:hypothetical protein